MISLKFAERSLLYGYSYMWTIVQMVFPPLVLQEPRDTKNLVLFHEIPFSRDVFYGPEWASVRQKWGRMVINLNIVLRYIIVFLHLYYLISLMFMTFEIQIRFLRSLGLETSDSLSSKVLYYTPLFMKTSIFVINVAAALILKQREWAYYDKYDIFSLSYREQFKQVFFTLLAVLPNAILEYIEMIFYVNLVPTDRYLWVQLSASRVYPFKSNPIISPVINVLLITACILSNTVRGRPLLNVIYAATCSSRHLRLINQQMLISNSSYNSTDEKPAGFEFDASLEYRPRKERQARNQVGTSHSPTASERMIADQSSSESLTVSSKLSMLAGGDASSASTLASHLGLCISRDHLFVDSLSPSSPDRRAQASASPALSGDSSASSQNSQVHLLVGKQLERSPAQSGSTRSLQLLEMRNRSTFARKIGLQVARMRHIRNLRQLELHIGRLQLFVSDMDKTASFLVFSMCLVNLIQFIHSAFFLIEFWNSKTINWSLGLLYCLSRMTTPGYLFVAGNKVEREAKRLITELELVYLQKETSCLIYKQYSNTMGSLSRVLKMLESIKFDCDGLMDINTGTMKKFIFYSVTAIFIIVQFDALNVLYNRSESVRN